jgi:hypothetical protein
MVRGIIILSLVIIVLTAAGSASAYVLNILTDQEAIDLFTKTSLITTILSVTLIILYLLIGKKKQKQ